MGLHARIESGYIAIDTAAWLEQRTGGPIPDLTADLLAWGDCAQAEDAVSEWADVVPRWLGHRGFTSPDPTDSGADGVIAHYGTRLDAELWVARATNPLYGPIAVVLVNDEPPVAYADTTLDGADWYDADSVDICCPNGHGWTWRTGRELLDATGSFTTLTVVFGSNLDAPFTACATCQDHQLGRRAAPCGCDRTPWIVCPTCGARCDVELPSR